MHAIFYLLRTDNLFARDRRAEAHANTLAQSISSACNLGNDIEPFDFHDKCMMKKLKEKLLMKDSDIHHVILPCGKFAQESVELFLSDVKASNIFIVFNSNWFDYERPNVKFGQIHPRQYFDIASTAPPSIKVSTTEIELLDALLLLTRVSFSDRYQNHGCLTPKPVDLDECNFREKLSSKETQLWSDAKEKVQDKILLFCIWNELASKYMFINQMSGINKDIVKTISFALLRTNENYKKLCFFKSITDNESVDILQLPEGMNTCIR